MFDPNNNQTTPDNELDYSDSARMPSDEHELGNRSPASKKGLFSFLKRNNAPHELTPMPEDLHDYPYEYIHHKDKTEERNRLMASTVFGCILTVVFSCLVALVLYSTTNIGAVIDSWYTKGLDTTIQEYKDYRGSTLTNADPEPEAEPVDKLNTTFDPGDSYIELESEHGESLTTSEIYELINPATVFVTNYTDVSSKNKNGTGVLFSSDGYIITNQHVVDGGTSFVVLLSDNTSHTAALVAENRFYDLAILKIDGSDYPFVAFGSTESVKVGDPVCAIGNPLRMELRGTLTKGIISAKNRLLTLSDGNSMLMLQTDASINSGNSGGPLINEYGQVIGINSSKMDSFTVSSEGLGFAIPSEIVQDVVNALLRGGQPSQDVSIGIVVETISSEVARGVRGLLIQGVSAESCGAEAGLQAGDYLMEVDGKQMNISEDLMRVRKAHKRGDTITFKVYRNGEIIESEGKLDIKEG